MELKKFVVVLFSIVAIVHGSIIVTDLSHKMCAFKFKASATTNLSVYLMIAFLLPQSS